MGAIPDSMAFVQESEADIPWHQTGTPVKGLMTAAECIKAAGLGWEVGKEQAYHNGKPVLNTFFTVRKDTGAVLGTVGQTYEVLQQAHAFSFFDGVVGIKGAHYETAGSLFGGRRVWLQARVGGDIVLKKRGKEDSIRKYVTLAHAHDGTMKVIMLTGGVRTVCENTLASAIENAETRWGIRHTKTIGLKLVEAREVLGLVNKVYEDMGKALKRLTEVQVDEDTMADYFQSLGFDPDAEKGKAKATYDQLVQNFETGAGSNLPTAAGTVYGLYNAVTQFTTHQRPTRLVPGYQSEAEAKRDSAMFGSTAKLADAAFDKALALVK